ncbi:MAG: AAA domain-containing protein, partial [Candidatus Eisenbacteria bacterium]|nr:AAA domain-containing protein [Candidatus Eisenbacteria bacterium]
RQAEYEFARGAAPAGLQLLEQALASPSHGLWRGELLRLQGEILLAPGRRASAAAALGAARRQLRNGRAPVRLAIAELAEAKCLSREIGGMVAGQQLRRTARHRLRVAGIPLEGLDLIGPGPVEFPTRLPLIRRRLRPATPPRRGNWPQATASTQRWAALGVITRSPALHHALLHAERIARSRIPVLIQGETGAGKEVLARAIHQMSGRRGRLAVFNAAASRHELLEAELFGHRRGAFTGAHRDREGVIVQAEGGTLFLDEIGDLPAAAQASLLRFLDRREIRPVGADRIRRIDARIIAATHRPLQRQVAADAFREDLYFRLAGVELEMPPLRERPEDLLPLLFHFAERHGADLAQIERLLAAGPGERILAYRWPGNVRQLGHWVDQLVALLRSEEDPRTLLRLIERSLAALPTGGRPRAVRGRDAQSLPAPSRQELIELVTRHRGNISAVAADLQTYRTHVYRLMRRRGIDHRRYRPRAREATESVG